MNTATHRPFSYISAFYGSGIILEHFTDFSFGYICLSIFILLFASAVFSKKAFISTLCLLFSIAGLGMAYTQSLQCTGKDDIRHVARYYRRNPVKVKGMVISGVQKSESFNRIKATFTLKIEAVQAPWGWQNISGNILVNMFNDPHIAYGDRIMIDGKLHRPYNFSPDKNFSYRDYLDRRGIPFILSVKKDAAITVFEKDRGNYFKAVSLRLSDALKDIFLKHLSKNEAGLMRAILLGDRSEIPKSIRVLFVQTGTAHILAISGLHIGIVAALFLIFAKILPIGRRWQFGIVIILLIGYAFLTGGRPSVIRATIMSIVFLTSFIVEKEFDALNTLYMAAAIILLVNPLNLFDVGFQLSFICVFIILYSSLKLKNTDIKGLRDEGTAPIGRFFKRWLSGVWRSFYLSLAIWIGVAGLIVYYFGIITPVTALANLIVVPLIGVVVALGFGLLLVGLILPSWGFMFAACLKATLNCLAGFIFLCDKIPFAYVYVKKVSLLPVIAYYTLLFIFAIIPWGRIDKPSRV